MTSFENIVRTAHAPLIAAARSARSNAPDAIRALVREVFRQSELIAEVAPSIEQRLIDAELALRSGASRGVREEDVISAVNEAVEQWRLPAFFKTSVGQFRLFRESREFLTRDFVKPGFGAGQSGWISPAEAIFLTTDLVRQKYFVEENQIDPDAWEARTRQRLEGHARQQREEAGGRARPSPSPPTGQVKLSQAVQLPVAADFRSEASPAVAELHRVLDRMGLDR